MLSRNSRNKESKPQKLIGERYKLGEEIGRGASGVVYRGLDTKTGKHVAVKEVSLERMQPSDISAIMGEVELLKSLNHVNVVQYLGSFQTRHYLYIVMELVEAGSLAMIIKKNHFGPFPESLVAVYIDQVLQGLAYLHSQGVVHRDIKGANILTNKEGLVKLADFGVAARLEEAPQYDRGQSEEEYMQPAGTPYWMAPEIVELKTVTASSDIWSVGCVAIELLTGFPPYFDLQPLSALYNIVQEPHPPLPNGASETFKDFLLSCFDKDPMKRPSAQALTMHPWIVQNRKSIKSLWGQTIKADSNDQYDAGVASVVQRLIAADLTSSVSDASNAGASTESFETANETRPSSSRPSDVIDTVEGYRIDSVNQAEFDEENQIDTAGQIALSRIVESGAFHQDPFSVGQPTNPHATVQDAADVIRQISSLKISSNSKERSLVEEAAAAASARTIDGYIAKHHQLAKVFVKADGLSSLRELFDSSSERVLMPCLDLLMTVITANLEALEEVCCLGIIPSALRFAAKQHPVSLRIRAGQFGHILATSSSFSSRLLISCQGIPFLMALVDEQPQRVEDFQLASLAISTFWAILRRTTLPGANVWPNQYLRLMAHHGVPHRVVQILPHVLRRASEMGSRQRAPRPQSGQQAESAMCEPEASVNTDIDSHLENFSQPGAMRELDDMLRISEGALNLFVALSFGDKVVKARCARKDTITLLLSLTLRMPTDMQEKVLLAIKSLSGEETVIGSLEEANGVAYASAQLAREDSPRLQADGLKTLKNMCQLSRTRQEKAARAGSVPWLCRLAIHPPKLNARSAEREDAGEDEAIALLCAMVHSSSKTRDLLWKSNALDVFLQLLKDEACQASVLEAITFWLDCDAARIEPKLLEDAAITRIVLLMPCGNDISETKLDNLPNITSPISKLVSKSRKIGLALSSSGLASRITELMAKSNPSTILSLMDLLKLLYEIQPHPQQFLSENKIAGILQTLVRNWTAEDQVLVSIQANKLLSVFSIDESL
ncbi:hypothetical protein M9434_002006 [Picochlorum sp. BPE23]|nr:hypothetical protein M9434_002006 [Picochlorum sp. BPE23]